MKPTVLVVDDKPNMLSLLSKVLRKSAHVLTARGVRTALALLTRERVHVVVCDLRMTDGDGLEVLRAVRQRWPSVPFATVPTAVQAMREGAFDYVTKPFDPDDLKVIVERALAHALAANVVAPADADGPESIPGREPAMRRVQSLVERAASADTHVLVAGEAGTGKSLVARAIHERSARASAQLVTVDCGARATTETEVMLFGHAAPPIDAAVGESGALGVARGGYLYLRDLDALPPAAQGRLMRVLDGEDVGGGAPGEGADVRLIGGTSRDLRALVADGVFREDLFFRLQACVIELPPLRARVSDIPLLARRFLDQRARDVPMRASGFSHGRGGRRDPAGVAARRGA
jgi:two-component system response regulator HydG